MKTAETLLSGQATSVLGAIHSTGSHTGETEVEKLGFGVVVGEQREGKSSWKRICYTELFTRAYSAKQLQLVFCYCHRSNTLLQLNHNLFLPRFIHV